MMFGITFFFISNSFSCIMLSKALSRAGLPPGWVEYKDPSSGRPFFYDTKNQRSQWNPPPLSASAQYLSIVNNGKPVKRKAADICKSKGQSEDRFSIFFQDLKRIYESSEAILESQICLTSEEFVLKCLKINFCPTKFRRSLVAIDEILVQSQEGEKVGLWLSYMLSHLFLFFKTLLLKEKQVAKILLKVSENLKVFDFPDFENRKLELLDLLPDEDAVDTLTLLSDAVYVAAEKGDVNSLRRVLGCMNESTVDVLLSRRLNGLSACEVGALHGHLQASKILMESGSQPGGCLGLFLMATRAATHPAFQEKVMPYVWYSNMLFSSETTQQE